MRMKRKWMFFAPPVFLGAVLLFGWIVMLLWNNILVPSLHIGALNFWQGVGLLILSRILFGSFGRGGGRWKQRGGPSSAFRQKWMNMSEEEKTKFREEWKSRCEKRSE
ncbi:MAG: hypothetical protein K2X48_05405 [Chitinophagaceae bacterium]|nr:hypothetical protein [Chitinophagaceae bacterium]